MSAFVVSKRDIDAIVTIALELEVSTRPGNLLGRLLWAENVLSVAYRYGMPDRDTAEHAGYLADVEAYAFEPLTLSAGAAAKIVGCYAYQSCEHDGWEASEAHRVIGHLEARLPHKGPDYDAAPWGNIERTLTPKVVSYAPEIQGVGEAKWTANGLRFATAEEALAYAENLQGRWMGCQAGEAHRRAAESSDPVSHAWVDGRAVAVRS
jgi:hypothetical protein